ncbi:unnamed protein product [Prunus armeniaca]
MNLFGGKKLDELLVKKLKITLLGLNALLNECYVREWLDELQDAVFDAEDLLDEIKTEALGCKVKADENRAVKPRCGTSSLLLLILFIKATC